MDAFPLIFTLVTSVQNATRCSMPYLYWGGFCLTNNQWGLPRSLYCADNSCSGTNCTAFSGGVYGLSRKLALKATEPDSPWAEEINGCEDHVTAHGLAHW